MSTNDVKSSLPLPPGSFGLPVVGETIAFLTDGKFAEKREKKYGPVFKTNIFGRPTVVMTGPEANQFLFANENKYFAATWPKSTRILLGPASLATQTGSFHQQRRKLMSQAFQPRALAGYLPAMERITASYLEKWQGMGTLTWYPELRNYTFDIASRLLVGSEGGSETKLGELFEGFSNGLFSIALPLPGTKFKKALRCRQQLLAEMEKIILRLNTTSVKLIRTRIFIPTTNSSTPIALLAKMRRIKNNVSVTFLLVAECENVSARSSPASLGQASLATAMLPSPSARNWK